MRPGTERVAALVEALGEPQHSYPVFAVSGTNGKFSIATIVTAILSRLGLRVGTYTSPHLESVRERIAIAHEAMGEQEFADVLAYLTPFIELVESERGDHLTFFELLTVMAIEAFFDAPVHAAVFEAGLGGEYDATNVADARVAIVANVSLDHVRQFGNDLKKAAWEKGGIAKQGSTVITGVEQDDLFKVIAERASERGAARVVRLGDDIDVAGRVDAVGGQEISIRGLHDNYDRLFLSLYGAHQARNAVLAVAACEAFIEERLSYEALAETFADVSVPGRLEVCGRRPLVICDGAHNPAAALAVREAIEDAFSYERLHVVLGMLDDKLIDDVIDVWTPIASSWTLTAPSAERAADPGRLELALEAAGVGRDQVHSIEGVTEAVDRAVETASVDDLVLVTGSFYTVGEARPWLRSVGRLPQG